MKKIAIILLLFFNYCSPTNTRNYFEPTLLKKIARLSSIEPQPAIINTPVYVTGINDSISESSFLKLKDVYKNSYLDRYSEFADFLFDALNQKIKIDTKNPKTYLYYSQTFLCDLVITDIYRKEGLKGIINKYCFYKDNNYRLNKGLLTVNQINSISYYFFINQYIRFDDDYYGTINFKKLSSAMHKYA